MRLKSIRLECKMALAVVILVSFMALTAQGQQQVLTFQGSTFQLNEPYTVTRIDVFHKASAQTGSVQLIDASGIPYGPWPAAIEPDRWVVAPGVTLPAGSYRLIDSDPESYLGQFSFYLIKAQSAPVPPGFPGSGRNI